MPPLCWRHHTLIQALLSRGPLKETEFQSIFSDVTGKSFESHQQLFNEYLRKINMELSYIQFELRACRNQYDSGVYYGVINTIADEQSKLGSKYTVPQIAFYKGIIEAIVQDPTAQGTISNINALNIRLENQGTSSQVPTAFKTFSMSQKEKTIQELVHDQWLCGMSDGRIGLGVRSFLDLRSWFHNNEVPACDVCNEAGVKADLCPNESCTVRIHKYCLQAKFSQQRAEKVCPGCGTQWPYVMAKSEAVEEDDTNVSQPPRGPAMRKRQKTSSNGPPESQPPENGQPSRRRVAVKVDYDGAGPSQEPRVVPGTRRATRNSARLHR
ncbi:hypothetical protein L1887_18845 [Cichorium endivia]|nr:hypothetical protein L1887_18845 [Cichorium endivia]